MFQIAICDDNEQYAKIFEIKLKEEFQKHTTSTIKFSFGKIFGSAAGTLEYFKKSQPDVIFLDIDMPAMGGFELAKILCNEYKDTLIIFMSAYDNFMYNAFDFMPFGYIQKDKLESELPRVISRLVEKLTECSGKITFNTTVGSVVLDLSKIVYFESAKNYYMIFLTNGKSYSCRGTLSDLEKQLSLFDFYRIHSAYLINLEHVCSVTEKNELILDNNKVVAIAQRRLPEFKKAYAAYTRRCYLI